MVVRLQVLRSRARGGLGEVFVAFDTELNRSVALKEPRAQRAHDPDFQARFLFEAEVTGRLEHPGIVDAKM
jgi:eukaryotic-like serine/threonine-protein kinase